ncbi:MAG: hypothetical protein AVDCRST_MAG91-3515 [uncultured Sphingomonadaceae bacterium]|uniref:DUF2231 domain-containing protein n=1 Tax=uncultured Sphingomonadaceae bacterium TaxID=169976 RepID=A0A6J4U0E9_9SPHN|nr:MAG: hypothetical protein AVDCRST_MAG91-3515 [uncultured Sphingomonadaceae bacterium]
MTIPMETSFLEQHASDMAKSPGDESPIRGLPSTAAVAGHPIHPMIIPYPIAFLTSALATDIAARRTGDAFWSRASKILIGAGILSGLAAGAVGAIDYYTIRRAREKTVGKLHAYGNPLALGLAAINLAVRRNKDGEAPAGGTVALTGATAALLGVTGWAGAELSYRHMVGVAGHGDQHDHMEKQVVQ